jgi:FixJ family two-component response regulator
MNREPTVFIVDDDDEILKVLSRFVLSMGLKPQAFASGLEFLRQFDPRTPGVVILDSSMPEISGLKLLERLSKEPYCPPVIFFSGRADMRTAVRAMQSGAVEFLEKSASTSELREAIGTAILLDAENRFKYELQLEARTRFEELSAPERKVLDLLISGCSHKVIASRLAISIRTVEDRRARLMKKLTVESLPQLVMLAVAAGLRPAEEPKSNGPRDVSLGGFDHAHDSGGSIWGASMGAPRIVSQAKPEQRNTVNTIGR